MRTFVLPVFALVLTGCASAPEQTAFNGRWLADVPPQGGCQFTSRLTMDVIGRRIVGSATNPGGTYPLSGSVNADGRGAFTIDDFSGTVDFSGKKFEANYANTCAGRHALGNKAS